MKDHLNKSLIREEYVIKGLRGWILKCIYGRDVKRVVYTKSKRNKYNKEEINNRLNEIEL